MVNATRETVPSERQDVDDPELVSAMPAVVDALRGGLARDAVRFLELELGVRLELRWYRVDRADGPSVFLTRRDAFGFYRHAERDSDEIWIRVDVDQGDLLRVLAHEARHRWQRKAWGFWTSEAERERDAAGYERMFLRRHFIRHDRAGQPYVDRAPSPLARIS